MTTYNLPVDYNALSITEKREVREQYIKQQGGRCHHCKAPLIGPPTTAVQSQAKLVNWSLFPPHFLKYPVHLHHHHTTGLTIGAVHARCNAVLWQYHGE